MKNIDPRITKLVKDRAGDKYDRVMSHAHDLILLTGKSPERAMADALEAFKLTKKNIQAATEVSEDTSSNGQIN